MLANILDNLDTPVQNISMVAFPLPIIPSETAGPAIKPLWTTDRSISAFAPAEQSGPV